MGSIKEYIKVEVPEGFPPQSMPCDPSTRYDDSDVVLDVATDADLPAIAHGLAVCFPRMWWDSHVPSTGEPTPEHRNKCLVERLKPMLRLPGFHPIKASINGELAGFAGWHGPERKGFFTNMFTMTAFREFEFDKIMGWSQADVDEMWSDINPESWSNEFDGYDVQRRNILGEVPHWYLAPLFVMEKFRGKGVGGKLLAYAQERADAKDPKTPLFLEALPNARPVYIHSGYEPQDAKGRETIMIRNDPRKW